MSKRKYLYEASFIKRLISGFLGAKSKQKESSFLDTLKKHDSELAAVFGNFNDKLNTWNKDVSSRFGDDIKSVDIKDTDVYKSLNKYMEEAINKRIGKKK
jgi:hypothetical protein